MHYRLFLDRDRQPGRGGGSAARDRKRPARALDTRGQHAPAPRHQRPAAAGRNTQLRDTRARAFGIFRGGDDSARGSERDAGAHNERNVIRRSEANGSRQEVIETYAFDDEGFFRSNGHLALHQRVRMSTTATPDGGRQTVEEVEGHNLAAYREPMRVVRRVVETVRQIDSGRWVTDRQVFELDLNGRLVPVGAERVERAAR